MDSRRQGPEPDYRFTLANERTYLAYVRTALAFLAGGVVLAQASGKAGQRLLAAAAVLVGAALGGSAYPRWRKADVAIRDGLPLPPTRLIQATSIALVVLAAGALAMIVVERLRG